MRAQQADAPTDGSLRQKSFNHFVDALAVGATSYARLQNFHNRADFFQRRRASFADGDTRQVFEFFVGKLLRQKLLKNCQLVAFFLGEIVARGFGVFVNRIAAFFGFALNDALRSRIIENDIAVAGSRINFSALDGGAKSRQSVAAQRVFVAHRGFPFFVQSLLEI